MNYYLNMEKSLVDSIVENLFAVMPVIHRKLLDFSDDKIGHGLSHYYYAILGMLSRTDSLAVSEIGKRLWISKPQMTAMIDKMVALGLVIRVPGVEDRRIVRISLTAAGINFLNQARDSIKKNVEKKISHISQDDLELLAVSLKNIKDIGSRLE
jgi:DNA-binding MarR family transcriptional regulator